MGILRLPCDEELSVVSIVGDTSVLGAPAEGNLALAGVLMLFGLVLVLGDTEMPVWTLVRACGVSDTTVEDAGVVLVSTTVCAILDISDS